MTSTLALERNALQNLSHILHNRPNQQINLDSFLASCEADLGQLSFSYKNSELCGASLHPDFIAFLQNRLQNRIQLLANFHAKLSHVLHDGRRGNRMNVTFLNGDSHNSGQRPVLLESDGVRSVLKFTDPRTTLTYNTLLQAAQQHSGLPPCALQVRYNNSYRFQISPYLEHSSSLDANAAEIYGHMLGIHLAVSYFLQMTDLHFENVITSEGIPYVVDTECMLYGFYDYPTPSDFRLMNTGLIAPKKSLSGIAGGDEAVSNIELHINKANQVKYTQDNRAFQNRLHDKEGARIPIKSYKNYIISGFRESFTFLLNNKLRLINEIPAPIILKFRTRFLFRTTAHYKTVVDRIHSPNRDGSHSKYLESTLSDFCRSGFLPQKINDQVIIKEITDLLMATSRFFGSTLPAIESSISRA